LNNQIISQFKKNEIDIFELVKSFDSGVEVKNKEEGVIYTPRFISDYIVSLVNPSMDDIILEPSVGHGVFIFSLINFIDNKYKPGNEEMKIWFEEKVIATDLNEQSIVELKLILDIYFEKRGIFNLNYKNIYKADALFENYTVDIVIGNPPYIRTKHLASDYLSKLRENFESCSIGNIDIYYAFVEKFSKTSKKLSFIVPSSYLSNKSASILRQNIIDKISDIIDFKEQLIFKNARTYTSIFLIDNNKNENIRYKNSIDGEYTIINKKNLNHNKWNFNEIKRKPVVSKEDMSKLHINGGMATLRDNIFTLKNPVEEGIYFKQIFNKKEYLIEKKICIKLFKITKSKDNNQIIHPYDNGEIMKESELSSQYPMAYNFLKNVRYELEKRDKGKTEKYENWFAYGRKQGMSIRYGSNYLLIPIMTNKKLNIKVINKKEKFIIVSGFIIESSDEKLMKKIEKSINSDSFFEFLKTEGKPWPGKNVYYSLTSYQLKKFLNNETSNIKQNSNKINKNYILNN
jgi:hypothetical protein